MSNPDRVVKVGQWWVWQSRPFPKRYRARVVRVGPVWAELEWRGADLMRAHLDKNGICDDANWTRASHPKPKIDRAEAERERIARAMQTRAQQVRESALRLAPQTIEYVAVLHAAMFAETWAKWIREGAK